LSELRPKLPIMLKERLQNVSFLQLGVIAVISYVLFDYIRRTVESRKIARLGSRAPMRKYMLPFGLDIAYGSVVSVVNNRVLEYFSEGMKKYGNPNWPYTVEFRVGKKYSL
jgi:hypothetical protein